MNIIPLRGKFPKIGKNVFLAPNCTIIGDVEIGDNCSIWFNVVIRGDVMPIKIGHDTNIQDGSIIHGTFNKCGTVIGDRVSVGHGVILHGCEVGNEVLIGMGSVLMDQSSVNEQSIVGAGSLITENSHFEKGCLIVGRPAKIKRELVDKEKQFLIQSSKNYLLYKSWYENSNSTEV